MGAVFSLNYEIQNERAENKNSERLILKHQPDTTIGFVLFETEKSVFDPIYEMLLEQL